MPSRSYNQPDGKTTINFTYTPIHGAAPPANSSFTAVCTRRLGSYYGFDNLGYGAKRRAGLYIPQAEYERFDFREDRPHGSYRGTYETASKGYTFRSNRVASMYGATASAAAAKAHCLTMSQGVNLDALLQAAIANCQADYDVLTSMAELHKSVRMIANARRSAAKLVYNALRRKPSFRYASEAVGRSWLEWRYGWRTLGFEISAAVDAFNAPNYRKFSYGNSATSVSTSYTAPVQSFSEYYNAWKETSVYTRELSVRAAAIAEHRALVRNVLASPVTTAWELVPFSFVADWFVSVGDALRAWQVISTVGHLSTSISYKFVETGKLSVSGVTLGTGGNATTPNSYVGEATSNAKFLWRRPAHTPSLIPRVRVNLSFGKVLDLAALLRTRIFN